MPQHVITQVPWCRHTWGQCGELPVEGLVGMRSFVILEGAPIGDDHIMIVGAEGSFAGEEAGKFEDLAGDESPVVARRRFP